MSESKLARERPDAREKLLTVALEKIRTKGFSATGVDEMCKAAGVTKGAFFHHFASKEALGVAAARHWSDTTSEMFAAAPYHDHSGPLDRILAYIDFRGDLIAGELNEFTCLAGTMVQEMFGESPAIRQACKASIWEHAETLEPDLQAAIDQYGLQNVTAHGLALHTQAVLQGGFILAKAKGDAGIARDTVAHLKRYFELLFREGERI